MAKIVQAWGWYGLVKIKQPFITKKFMAWIRHMWECVGSVDGVEWLKIKRQFVRFQSLNGEEWAKGRQKRRWMEKLDDGNK